MDSKRGIQYQLNHVKNWSPGFMIYDAALKDLITMNENPETLPVQTNYRLRYETNKGGTVFFSKISCFKRFCKTLQLKPSNIQWLALIFSTMVREMLYYVTWYIYIFIHSYLFQEAMFKHLTLAPRTWFILFIFRASYSCALFSVKISKFANVVS